MCERDSAGSKSAHEIHHPIQGIFQEGGGGTPWSNETSAKTRNASPLKYTQTPSWLIIWLDCNPNAQHRKVRERALKSPLIWRAMVSPMDTPGNSRMNSPRLTASSCRCCSSRQTVASPNPKQDAMRSVSQPTWHHEMLLVNARAKAPRKSPLPCMMTVCTGGRGCVEQSNPTKTRNCAKLRGRKMPVLASDSCGMCLPIKCNTPSRTECGIHDCRTLVINEISVPAAHMPHALPNRNRQEQQGMSENIGGHHCCLHMKEPVDQGHIPNAQSKRKANEQTK